MKANTKGAPGRRAKRPATPETKLSPEEEARRIAELHARSTEQRQNERAELDRFVAEMRDLEARGQCLDELERVVPEEPVEAIALRVMSRVAESQRVRLQLPCYQAMYPDGREPASDIKSYRDEDPLGKAACDAVEWYAPLGKPGDPGYREPCGWQGKNCPRDRVIEQRNAAAARLTRARVPDDDLKYVLNIVAGRVRKSGLAEWVDDKPITGQYLDQLDVLRVARAIAGGAVGTVELRNGAERRTGGRTEKKLVSLLGNELVFAFGGNIGRGKSIAAQLLIATAGGLYTTEYDFGRPRTMTGKVHGVPQYEGLDIHEAIKATPWLVIDQVGRAALGGESRFLIANIEEVLDKRRAAGRRTILVGNFTYEQILERYGDRKGDDVVNLLLDRILGYGVMVEFGGDSLREHLREGA